MSELNDIIRFFKFLNEEEMQMNIISQIRKIVSKLNNLTYIDNTNVDEVVELVYDLWLNIAQTNKLPVRPVTIYESKKKEAEIKTKIKMPFSENLVITPASGWAVFVDFTHSTKYFGSQYENYTGLIAINAYITLVKLLLQLEGGEFLEHTGDGAFLFFDKGKFGKYEILLILLKLFDLGERLKRLLYSHELLEVIENIYSFPLVRIGAAFGKGRMVKWGNERKFISNGTWRAASNQKSAPREILIVNGNQERITDSFFIEYFNPWKTYEKLKFEIIDEGILAIINKRVVGFCPIKITQK